MQILMDLARIGNLEGLLDLVPDSVVERALERKQQMRYENGPLQHRHSFQETGCALDGDVHRLTCLPWQPLCQDGQG